ncbi:hypothetical protein MCEMAEM6B_02144 [Mycobacteriaceae bacterium]
MTDTIDEIISELKEELGGDDPTYFFWNQRDTLRHVYLFARSRRVAPSAVLACVLRRAVSAVPPNVVIPPIIGNTVSLNLFTATLGRSGQGKDAADGAGFAAVEFPSPAGLPMEAPRPQIGTGEGLARLFKGSKSQEPLIAAHLVVPEIGTLAAIAGRQGATLSAELLKAYMGQPLGFQNASSDTTTAVAAHSYRLCLGVNSQPENAAFFLDRATDGFPQRFLWASATDPYAPLDRPDPVEPIDILLPTFGTSRHEISVPPLVWAEMDTHRTRVLTEDPDVDPLDGHLMLTRLKVAFALAILDTRSAVDMDDWRIAGQLIDLSTATRNSAQAAVVAQRKNANRSRAHDQAERESIVIGRLTEDRQARVGKAIVGKLRRVKRANRSDLRRSCAAELRTDFDPVLDTLLDTGFLVAIEGGDGRAAEYELAEK